MAKGIVVIETRTLSGRESRTCMYQHPHKVDSYEEGRTQLGVREGRGKQKGV